MTYYPSFVKTLLNRFILDQAHKEKRAFLAQLPIFRALKSRDFTYLIGILQERTYLKGETLFVEGDIGRALFIVADGKVDLMRQEEGGKAQKLAEVKRGEIFGEMALLEEMPRTATAVAAEKTEVFMLFKKKLDALIYENPRVGALIVHYLAQTVSSRLRARIEADNVKEKGA